MEMTFKSMLDKYVLVSLDEITMYSKSAIDYFGHMRKFFIKCRDFGMSLNPRKCLFSTNRGNLFRHIMSGDGLESDPKRVKPILSLPLPHHKKRIVEFPWQD